MTFGVSTACLYPDATEDALLSLAKLGVKETEIFFNAESELSGALLKKLLGIKNEYGVKVSAVHPFTSGFEPFLLFSRYERRFSDALELYKKYAAAAAALGASYIVIHGDGEKGLLSDDEYFGRFRTLRESCKAYGAEPIQENVNLFRASSPAFLLDMKAALGEDIGFALDIKQCVRSGRGPFEVAKAMSGHIRHVHVSDHTGAQSCLLPGRGGFDFARLFAFLKAEGYSGSVLIEV